MGYDASLGQQASAKTTKTATRIEGQVENVKALTRRIVRITDTNIEHAHQLGFFSPPPSNGSIAGAPTPVISSLDDALRELTMAVDNLDGSMNLYA